MTLLLLLSGSGAGGAPAPVIQVGVPEWPLSVQMYDVPGGTMLADWSGIAKDLKCSTGEHGFGAVTFFVPLSAFEAIRFYQMVPAKHLLVKAGPFTVWEGRVEDRRVVADGLEVGGFGYWRAMADVPYTALWSSKSYGLVRVVSNDELSTARPEKWAMDNNNRVFFALVTGELYSYTPKDQAYQIFELPHRGERKVMEIEFDYATDLPVNFWLRVIGYNEGFLNASVEWTFTSTGVAASATGVVVTFANPRDHVVFQCGLSAAPAITYTGETANKYAKITNLRVKTTASNALYADEIVNELISFVNKVNPTQISAATLLVQSPGVDLDEESYEDMVVGDILSYLAEKGDSQTPPAKWEVGVWEDQVLHFRERGSEARNWYTDVVELELDSTLDLLINGVYAVYESVNNRALRTVLGSDPLSQSRYAIVRRSFVKSSTTSSTTASKDRDAALEERKQITPRVKFVMSGLFTVTGANVPLWMLRANDTLTLRNLPPTLGTSLDKVRRFRVVKTSFDAETGIVTPIPEFMPPDMVTQIGQILMAIRPPGIVGQSFSSQK